VSFIFQGADFMTSVAIIYFSGTGHTHLMAEAVAAGTQKVSDTTIQLLRITGEQIVNGRWQGDWMLESLNQADAIRDLRRDKIPARGAASRKRRQILGMTLSRKSLIFGSPTYMGGVASQLKAFIDAASGIWFAQGWKNKIAGGFTHSGSPSGDKQGTLLYLAINAAQHSMIWVGNWDFICLLGLSRCSSKQRRLRCRQRAGARRDFHGTVFRPVFVSPGQPAIH
jgi:NAD(P)H dehydrogenase (quinone)